MGLGSLSDFTLHEARDRARRARQLLYDGLDPIVEKHATVRKAKAEEANLHARSKTFDDVTLEYFDQHQLKWKNRKHRAQFLSTLNLYAHPIFGHLPVAHIDKALVLKALDPIWQSKPETASRVRRRIEAVLNFSTVRGYRDGENPARWRGHLDQVLLGKSHIQKVTHHRALPYSELPEFLAALRQRQGTAARAVEFVILTGARTSEVTGAVWQEFDLDNKAWIVPACRMKAKRDHRVPLSDTVVALLRKLPREEGNPYVFVGPRKNGLSNMAMDAVLRRMDLKDRATIHGFRSSFRDWSAEQTNYPNHVAEAALAHVVGDKVEAAYRRGDLFEKRRAMMADWAHFCERTVTLAKNSITIKAA